MKEKQIIALIVGVVVVVVVGVGVGVAFMIKSKVDRAIQGASAPAAKSTSTFVDATWLVPALETRMNGAWIASACKLTLTPGGAELIAQREGVARRYTTTPTGKVLRRGGAVMVAAEPFDLNTLDLGLVPGIVADAAERAGSDVSKIIVGRDEEGLLLWRAVPRGEAADVYYTADGSFVPDPDNI